MVTHPPFCIPTTYGISSCKSPTFLVLKKWKIWKLWLLQIFSTRSLHQKILSERLPSPRLVCNYVASGQMWLQHLRIKRILQHAAKHLGSKSRGSRNITHLWCYIYTEGLWRWWKIISQTHLQGFYPWWSLAVKTTILSEKHETRCWPMSSHFQMSGGMDRNNRKATEKWNTWLSSIFYAWLLGMLISWLAM